MFSSQKPVLAWLLAGLMFCSPLWAIELAASPAHAAEPAASPAAAAADRAPAAQYVAAAAKPIELSYLTEDTCVAVRTHPARLIGAPEFELMPIEILEAAMLQYVGIDPHHVAELLFTVELAPNPSDPPVPVVIARFSQPYDLADLFPAVRSELEESQLNGRLLLAARNPREPSLYMPDDTTLIFAHETTLPRILGNDSAPDTRLAALLDAAGSDDDLVAVFDADPVRDIVQAIVQGELPPLPRPLERLKQIPELLAAAQLQLNLTGDRASRLELIALDDASAEEMESIINDGLDFGRQMSLAQMEFELDAEDPVQKSVLDYAQRTSEMIVEAVRPERSGDRLAVTYQPAPGEQTAAIASIGVLVALLLPAVNAAREAARRAQSMNQMRQLGLGMLNYESARGRFPAAGGDEESRPGLSWRVHILPYIEEGFLYEQFHLDEPWDSEHNIQLVEQMPAILYSPNVAPVPGETHYQLVVGEGTAFNGGDGPRMRDFEDGTSNTVLLVEADEPVIWTKPDDWEYDPQDPTAGLGHIQRGGFLAAFVDGSVRVISNTIDPSVLEAFFTHQGGEDIGGADLP